MPIFVVASPGLKVPMEGKPRDYITDAAPVAVEESAYYLRRMAEGDLVIAEPAAPKKKGAD